MSITQWYKKQGKEKKGKKELKFVRYYIVNKKNWILVQFFYVIKVHAVNQIGNQTLKNVDF